MMNTIQNNNFNFIKNLIFYYVIGFCVYFKCYKFPFDLFIFFIQHRTNG